MNGAASCFECEGGCGGVELSGCVWKLNLAGFEIVITVTKAIITAVFPPALVVQLARKLALELVLGKHASEGEDAGLQPAKDGESGAGEGGA